MYIIKSCSSTHISTYKSYKCIFLLHVFDTIVPPISPLLVFFWCLNLFSFSFFFFETSPMPRANILPLVKAWVQTRVFCFGLVLKGCLSQFCQYTSLFARLTIHFPFIQSSSRHINMTGGIQTCIQSRQLEFKSYVNIYVRKVTPIQRQVMHVLKLIWAPRSND